MVRPMVFELGLKILLILIATLLWGATVRWVWVNHIDPKATITRLFSKTVETPDWVATRDPKKIYQNGEAVGDVSGEVEDSGDQVIFRELSNTAGLDRKTEFEYQRKVLRIRKIGTSAGMKLSPSGTRMNVLGDVVCDLVK